jgi:hypothetical protein
MNGLSKKSPHAQDLAALNCVGKFVSINDSSGREWFRGKALEHIAGSTYRFRVFMIGGRLLEAEMIADLTEIAGAAVDHHSAV